MINSEIVTLAKQIQDKLVLYMSIASFNGSELFDKYFNDSVIIYSNRKALEYHELYDNLTYEELQTCITTILQYFYASELEDPLYVGSTISEEISPTTIIDERESYILPITSNGQNVFSDMPFSINDIDIDSVDLYINGDHVGYSTVESDHAFHMVNSTLYWHGWYELKIGDIGILKWG